MTNEQLLMEIGRMMGKAIQESEERMKVYVHDVVTSAIQASEERMKLYVNDCIQASEERMKLYVNDCIQASEERMKLYVNDRIQASEERMNVSMGHLSLQIQELSCSVENLRGAVRHTLVDTEKLAQQIAATVERMERFESASA